MERSERSSTGKAAGSPAAAERGAPGHATSTADAGAAPPIDPDDEAEDLDALGDDDDEDELEGVRAEPWVPDASLMRALGLELDELRPRADAGEPDLTDEPARPAPAEPRAEAEARVGSDEGRLPWW